MERNVPKLRFKGFNDEWKEAKFKELLNVIDGDRGVNYPKEDEFTEEGYCLFLNAKNVTKEGFKFNENKFISSEKDSILRKGKLERNDIVLTTRGTVGNRAIFTTDIKYDNIRINSGMVLLRANKIEPHYLYSYMKSIQFDKQLKQIMFGSAQPQLTVKDINEFKVSLPSIQEQERIANFLTKVDKIIEKQDEKVKNLENYKKGMMQKIFSQEIRFKDENGEEYPEWEERRLGDFIIEYTEKTTENNQYEPLTSSRKGLFLQSEYFNKQIASEDNTGYNIVPKGYFTYRHMSDDSIFYFNINDIIDFGIVSTLYPVFTVNEGMNSRFLRYYLNEGYDFKKYCLLQKQGGSRTYMYLNKLKGFRGKFPVIMEQNKIAKFLLDIDSLVNKEKEKLEELKQWKKGLLQQMFV